MKIFRLFLLLLLTVSAYAQAPIRRQFFTTNDNPIVDVVAGSNATVQASTPAANIRRFTVNSLTDTNIVTAIAQAQTNGLATTNFVISSQLWTNSAGTIVPTTNAPVVVVDNTLSVSSLNTNRFQVTTNGYVRIGKDTEVVWSNSKGVVVANQLGIGDDTYREITVVAGEADGSPFGYLSSTVASQTYSGHSQAQPLWEMFAYNSNGPWVQSETVDWKLFPEFDDLPGASSLTWYTSGTTGPKVLLGFNPYSANYGLPANFSDHYRFNTYTNAIYPLLAVYNNNTNKFQVNTNGDISFAGIAYGNGAGLTNLPSGGTGSSNITDSAYYAVARNLTVNTNADINNLTVTNLTVDSGSGIGYLSLENSGTNIITLNGTNGTVTSVTNVSQYFIGDGSGLTNLSVVGLSNITDSGYVAVARNLTVSTNTTFAGSVIATNGYTSTGTNAIYSLWSSGTDYERYLFEPEDTRLTIRADTAGTGDDNLSVRIMPVGNGAFFLDNAGTTAGNTRGTKAVDLQTERYNAANIASGRWSFLAGINGQASADGAVSLGGGNVASAAYSTALGSGTAASGSYSTSVGFSSVASRAAQFAHASGIFTVAGDAQYSRVVARATGTSSTSTNLLLLGTSGTINIPPNSSWSFQIQITARSTDAGTGDEESAAYEIKGLIERDNSAAATRIVGSPIVTTIAEDDALWDVSVTADTTNGALQINVQGNNETAVRWVATVHLTEVGG